ncbi:hypothetical protein EV359DRAFT_67658 [Lentinula novae-zelandiae]|nr:hypothetical protein EV359DRAFT_67658 [Lentinula novae-zelandiae]
MEDHEKHMQNFLKEVHDLGGTATDAQFRTIIISSMPPDWRQDMCSIPEMSSTDAFTYLHMLWYEKEEERKEEEQDTKHIKVLMAAHSYCKTWVRPGSELVLNHARSKLELKGSYGNCDRGQK